MNDCNPAVKIENLFFRYPRGDYVLKDLSLVLNKGESALVIGDSGSGKTTLARVLLGTATSVYEGDLHGSLEICGKRIEEISLGDAHRLIHVISQNPYIHFTEPLVIDDLTAYSTRVYGSGPRSERALKKVVETLGIHDLLYKYNYELSGGEARRVLVAKALLADSEILVFDEPLMWLDERGINDFVDLLGLIKRLGKTTIVFEHRFLRLIDAGFDKVFLLKNGRLTDITLRLIDVIKKTPPMIQEKNNVKKTQTEKPVLVVERVKYSVNGRTILNGVDLKLRKGDKVLIYGENGAGKTTLLKILAGYLKPSRGKIIRRTNIMYIPQNIVLFFNEATVRDEIEEICKARRLGNECIMDGYKKVQSLGIRLEQSPFNLSHGQMIKLAITISIISRADLLLMDEPFSGLSYADRAKLVDFIEKTDAAIVMTTSNLDAVQTSVWTSMLRLDDGVLRDLGVNEKSDLLAWASRVYEGLNDGISD